MKRYIFYIEHTYGDDQKVWTDANSQSEAEDQIMEDYHSIKRMVLLETKKL